MSNKEDKFEVLCEEMETRVEIGENGQICEVSVSTMEMEPVWFETSGDPHNEDSIVDVTYAFECMMENDIETFKAMLKRIKDSDPEYYEEGITVLKNKKEQIIREAEKYSL